MNLLRLLDMTTSSPRDLQSRERMSTVRGRLPAKIGFACLEFIYGAVAGNPQRACKAVLYPLDGQFSARRGSYRVVYRVDDDRSVVLINRIDHRADVFCM